MRFQADFAAALERAVRPGERGVGPGERAIRPGEGDVRDARSRVEKPPMVIAATTFA